MPVQWRACAHSRMRREPRIAVGKCGHRSYVAARIFGGCRVVTASCRSSLASVIIDAL